jgi:broad specificity phosphatase PhoE
VGTEAWEAAEALKDEYTDPDLTERGRAQCAAFAEGLPAALASGLSPRLIICSPMQRALRTAALCLSALPEPLPWVAVETARETLGRHTCDRRREVNEEVERAHPRVQFHLLRERHDALWTPQRETDEEQLLRAQRLLDFIFAAPEEHVLVVAHSGILTSLAKLFAQPLREHDLSPAPKGEGASATSSPTPAPVSHPHASLLDAVNAPSIASRHCELQPFIVARLPLAGQQA